MPLAPDNAVTLSKMSYVPMNAPAVLFRAANDDQNTPDIENAIVVASGPFIIMVYSYLSFTAERRNLHWISSAAGNVMPGEIEEAMRVWHERAKPATSNGA